VFPIGDDGVIFLLILVIVITMFGCGNPHTALPVLHGLILVGKIETLLPTVLAAL
jgi:hypothetical protein